MKGKDCLVIVYNSGWNKKSLGTRALTVEVVVEKSEINNRSRISRT